MPIKKQQNFNSSLNSTIDLGLFNQLLQMVDGDWSDSIQGICSHILGHFNAMGVVLSVFDRSFQEFIYIAYAIDENSKRQLIDSRYDINMERAKEIIKAIYHSDEHILSERSYSRDELVHLIRDTIKAGADEAVGIITMLDPQVLFSVPVLESNDNYECVFHVFLKNETGTGMAIAIDEYLPQLNIALEIIFLVRELYIKATHDWLTKLFNHKQGIILLEREITRVERTGEPLCLVMVDLDHFKNINDTFGHQSGNEVLHYFGNLLMDSLRKSDISSRYGGEEFMLVLPNTELKTAIEVARRIKEKFAEHIFNFAGAKIMVTASFGIVEFNEDIHEGPDSIIRAVDACLYQAKTAGRNTIIY